jgi:EAL domain-containing protein (putative c-di-GMP-specific phosphodiesterase class I)
LEAESFELHLQPIVDLRTDRTIGAEALVRMREGDQLIPPRKFVDVAESSGLVVELDQVVARLGVALLADLTEVWPGFQLQINVSAGSFGLPAFENTLVRALSEHDLDGSRLVLEITESTQLRNFRAARAFGERMTRLGCRLALDDFGAGWGSYYYLKYLPIAFLKIDGEFVTEASGCELDRTLVRSVVRLAADLGAQTIAEYVQDEAALALVREEGADFAQGFLLGEPVPVTEFLHRFAPSQGAPS